MIATRTLPKYFNTAGPIQPDIHYTVEPLSRIDLEEVEQLIYQRKYFILHAPRQTGKTSCLLALRDYLNARGEFIAVYANVEAGQAARNDVARVVEATASSIANAIYKEVIPRELTWARQQTLTQQSAWYIRPDGSIDMQKLLLDFQQFFRQNADSWIEKFDYKESGPQLLLQAFLQRVVNGGGYIDRCGGTVNEGHFILFDRHPNRPWDEKLWHYRREYNGREIEVWGM